MQVSSVVLWVRRRLCIAVGDIFAGHLIRFGLHDGVFHQILDLLHVHGVVAALAFLRHIVGNGRDLFLGQALVRQQRCWLWSPAQ